MLRVNRDRLHQIALVTAVSAVLTDSPPPPTGYTQRLLHCLHSSYRRMPSTHLHLCTDYPSRCLRTRTCLLLFLFHSSSFPLSSFQLAVQYSFSKPSLIYSVHTLLPRLSIFIYFLIMRKDIQFSRNIFIPHIVSRKASFNGP